MDLQLGGQTLLRVIGPIDGFTGEHSISLGEPQAKAVLAALLLRANHSVDSTELIGQVWGASAPASAPTALRVQVSRLRQVFGPSGKLPIATIEHDASGYRLVVDPERTDVHHFERLFDQARDPSLDRAESLQRVNECLGFWRGNPYSGMDLSIELATEVERLTQIRLAAIELRLSLLLELGRPDDMIAEADQMAVLYPHRERFTEQLVTGLYRCDRQVDALRAYRRTNSALAEEYGLSPSKELQQLEQSVLLQSADLDWRDPTSNQGNTLPRSLAERRISASYEAEFVALVACFKRAPTPNDRFVLFGANGAPEIVAAMVAREACVGNARILHLDIAMQSMEEMLEALLLASSVQTLEGTAPRVLVVVEGAELLDDENCLALFARLDSLAHDGAMILVTETVGSAFSEPATSVVSDESQNDRLHVSKFAPSFGALVIDLRSTRAAPALDALIRTVSVVVPVHSSKIVAGVGDSAESFSTEDLASFRLHAGTPVLKTIQPSVLIGREGEVDELIRWMEESKAGKPRFVVVEGRAGVGKSHLVSVLTEKARSIGVDVHGGACHDGMRVPLAAIRSIISASELSVTESPSRSQSLPSAQLPQVADFQAAHDAFTDGALRSIVERSKSNPVLLVLEDVHWADSATLDVIEALVNGPMHPAASDPVQLMIAVTIRTETHTITDPRLERVGRAPGVRRISLTGLSEPSTGSLIKSLVAHPVSPSLTAELHELTLGIPLLVVTSVRRLTELSHLVIERGLVKSTTPPRLTIPSDVNEAIGDRLAALTPDAREFARGLSLLGDSTPIALIALANAVSREQVVMSALELSDRDLVRIDGNNIAFSHALVRRALLSELSDPERQLRQRRIAVRIRDHVHDDFGVMLCARQLSDAAAAADPSEVALWSVRAGDLCFRSAMWIDATRFFEAALATRAVGDGGTRRRIRLAAGLAAYHLHDLERVRRHLGSLVVDAEVNDDLTTWGRALLSLQQANLTMQHSEASRLDELALTRFIHVAEAEAALAGDNDHNDHEAVVRELSDIRSFAHMLLSESAFVHNELDEGLRHAEAGAAAASETFDDNLRVRSKTNQAIIRFARLELDAANSAQR